MAAPTPNARSRPVRRRIGPALLVVLLFFAPHVLKLGRLAVGEDTAFGARLFRPPVYIDLHLWAEMLRVLGLLAAVVWAYVWFARRVKDRPGRWAALCVNLGLSLVVVLGVCVLVECAFRLRPIGTDTYGSSHGTTNWFRKYGVYNSWCFRGHEFQLAKPKGVARIVVIGDSVAFGHGINRPDDRLSEVLQRRLDAHTPGGFEVINLSDSGVATETESGWLEFLAMRLDPDAVVLVHVLNDIFDSAERPLVLKGLGRSLETLRRHSYLADRLLFPLRVVYTCGKPYPDALADLYADPEVWGRHASILRWFCRFGRSRGVPVIVGIHPFLSLVNAYPANLGDVSDRLRGVCNEASARSVDFRDAFAGHAAAELVVGANDRHPNELAHRLMGEALAAPVLEAIRAWAQTTQPAETADAVPVKDWPVPEARAAAERAVRAYPNSSRALTQLAMRSGWMGGSKYLALAIRLNPRDEGARFLYGRWWVFRYRNDLARDQYGALVRLGSPHAEKLREQIPAEW
jgi:lysophospholipase L1-like esterase